MQTAEFKSQFFRIESVKFFYSAYMLNRLRKKAKKKMNKDQFSIFEETREKFNQISQLVNEQYKEEDILVEFDQSKIDFLCFFFKSTSEQNCDEGESKVLYELYIIFSGKEI